MARARGSTMVVTIATPPIQCTSASTCTARASVKSSIVMPAEPNKRPAACQAAVSGIPPVLINDTNDPCKSCAIVPLQVAGRTPNAGRLSGG